MDLRILTSPDEFAKIREDWNSLVDRSAYPNFFLRAEWLLAWWKWFGKTIGTYHFLLVYDNGQLVGGFPLFRQRRGKLKIQGFDGLTCPEYLGLVVLPDRIEPVAEVLVEYFASSKDWTELFFEDYAAEDPGTAYFAQCLKRRFPAWEHPGEPRYYIPLPETYEDYLKTRSSKNRQKKRHDVRVAKEDYQARLVEPNFEDIDRWFPILQFFSRSSIGRKHFPPLMRKNFAGLYRDLLVELLPSHQARVFMLYYGETPASFFAGFVCSGKFYSYQTGFDPQQPGRPGSTVIQLLLMRLIEENFCEFDFLRGVQDYKKWWTESARETVSLAIFRRSGASYYRTIFVENFLRPLWRRIKRLRSRFSAQVRPKTGTTEKSGKE